MSDDKSPSTLTCALVGLGGAAVVAVGMTLLSKKAPAFGALQDNALADAFGRLMDAEEAFEDIKAQAWDEDEDQWRVGLLPRLQAAEAQVKKAKADLHAVRMKLSGSGVIHLTKREMVPESRPRPSLGEMVPEDE
jgi:hypothetical protein